jgi:hypothetical protein
VVERLMLVAPHVVLLGFEKELSTNACDSGSR